MTLHGEFKIVLKLDKRANSEGLLLFSIKILFSTKATKRKSNNFILSSFKIIESSVYNLSISCKISLIISFI